MQQFTQIQIAEAAETIYAHFQPNENQAYELEQLEVIMQKTMLQQNLQDKVTLAVYEARAKTLVTMLSQITLDEQQIKKIYWKPIYQIDKYKDIVNFALNAYIELQCMIAWVSARIGPQYQQYLHMISLKGQPISQLAHYAVQHADMDSITCGLENITYAANVFELMTNLTGAEFYSQWFNNYLAVSDIYTEQIPTPNIIGLQYPSPYVNKNTFEKNKELMVNDIQYNESIPDFFNQGEQQLQLEKEWVDRLQCLISQFKIAVIANHSLIWDENSVFISFKAIRDEKYFEKIYNNILVQLGDKQVNKKQFLSDLFDEERFVRIANIALTLRERYLGVPRNVKNDQQYEQHWENIIINNTEDTQENILDQSDTFSMLDEMRQFKKVKTNSELLKDINKEGTVKFNTALRRKIQKKKEDKSTEPRISNVTGKQVRPYNRKKFINIEYTNKKDTIKQDGIKQIQVTQQQNNNNSQIINENSQGTIGNNRQQNLNQSRISECLNQDVVQQQEYYHNNRQLTYNTPDQAQFNLMQQEIQELKKKLSSYQEKKQKEDNIQNNTQKQYPYRPKQANYNNNYKGKHYDPNYQAKQQQQNQSRQQGHNQSYNNQNHKQQNKQYSGQYNQNQQSSNNQQQQQNKNQFNKNQQNKQNNGQQQNKQYNQQKQQKQNQNQQQNQHQQQSGNNKHNKQNNNKHQNNQQNKPSQNQSKNGSNQNNQRRQGKNKQNQGKKKFQRFNKRKNGKQQRNTKKNNNNKKNNYLNKICHINHDWMQCKRQHLRQKRCKFGMQCNKVNSCKFYHPYNKRKCKYGKFCANQFCLFDHKKLEDKAWICNVSWNNATQTDLDEYQVYWFASEIQTQLQKQTLNGAAYSQHNNPYHQVNYQLHINAKKIIIIKSQDLDSVNIIKRVLLIQEFTNRGMVYKIVNDYNNYTNELNNCILKTWKINKIISKKYANNTKITIAQTHILIGEMMDAFKLSNLKNYAQLHGRIVVRKLYSSDDTLQKKFYSTQLGVEALYNGKRQALYMWGNDNNNLVVKYTEQLAITRTSHLNKIKAQQQLKLEKNVIKDDLTQVGKYIDEDINKAIINYLNASQLNQSVRNKLRSNWDTGQTANSLKEAGLRIFANKLNSDPDYRTKVFNGSQDLVLVDHTPLNREIKSRYIQILAKQYSNCDVEEFAAVIQGDLNSKYQEYATLLLFTDEVRQDAITILDEIANEYFETEPIIEERQEQINLQN